MAARGQPRDEFVAVVYPPVHRQHEPGGFVHEWTALGRGFGRRLQLRMPDSDRTARPHAGAVDCAIRDNGEHALDYRAVCWSSVGLVQNRDTTHQVVGPNGQVCPFHTACGLAAIRLGNDGHQPFFGELADHILEVALQLSGFDIEPFLERFESFIE